MTILYTLFSTDPYAGSTKSFMILLRGVLAKGLKAIVVVPDTNGVYDTLREMGVEVIVQNDKGSTWTGAKNLKQTLLYVPRQLGRMAVNYRSCRSLEKKLAGVDFDLVHSNVSISSLGRYIAGRRDLPHLYHIREYGDKDFGLRYFPSKVSFHRRLKAKNVYSACITKDIQRYHGLSGLPSSRVIYNGIIDETAMPVFTSTNRGFLLYAGRIEPAKGLLTLVTAYKLYCDRTSRDVSLPLKVAGEVIDESYMNKIQHYIESNNLGKKIQFLGKVVDMPHLYQQAKAIVIPSECEGFGRCMPEAMAHGCLVIAHNTGGSKEQLDNGLKHTGKEIGFRYDNEKELAGELAALHTLQEQELMEMRQRAYQCVCELYSYKTYINSIIGFYNEIVSKDAGIPTKAVK